MAFLKKLKETSEKAFEKGAEVETKAYEGTREAIEKGRDKARTENHD
jgi:hypothetical protein